jgi:heavy metal sensor kinase
MKLSTRVSAFFLATLAVALASYSLAFYWVTREHIDAQFRNELQGVLHSLVAAAEVEETEVKWQPLEHSISFGSLDEFGEVDWIVIGDQSVIVEQARTVTPAFRTLAKQLANSGVARGTKLDASNSHGGQMLSFQRLSAPRPVRLQRELDEFDEVMVVVGRSTVQRDAILWRLTMLVVLLPLAAWLIAALLGRWIARRALLPVTAMSNQAQSIAGADFQARLKVSDSGDELSELGAAFNRLLDRQQIAFEQQQRFAGDAAHELRTPLTVLLGQIDVTLRRPRTESEYAANLQLLRGQTRTLQEIVEALLFLARSDSDAAALSLQQLDLQPWLAEQAAAWSKLPRSVDIQFQNDLGANVEVRGTAALLTRIVDNLVANALKYSAAGSPVTVRATSSAGQALVQVSDSGSGIHPEDLEHIFEPFFRSGAARSQGIAGTGLGLAIAQRIATTLGGSLQCESTLGQGSCFTLRLPIVAC